MPRLRVIVSDDFEDLCSGSTNLDHHFSWCIDHLVEDVLRVTNFSQEHKGSSSMVDTYIHFDQLREHRSVQVDVRILLMPGQVIDLGVRAKLEVFREERCDVVHIAGAVGYEHPVYECELRGATIGVGHRECMCGVFVRQVVVSVAGDSGGGGRSTTAFLCSNANYGRARTPVHHVARFNRPRVNEGPGEFPSKKVYPQCTKSPHLVSTSCGPRPVVLL